MRAFLERLRPWAPLTLRLILAVIFVYHGQVHVFDGRDKFVGLVKGMGFPLWMATLAAWSELAGGALMGLGLLTRVAALMCAGVMMVAVFKVHLHQGWSGLEFPLLCLAGCISLLLSGAGRLSVDNKIAGR